MKTPLAEILKKVTPLLPVKVDEAKSNAIVVGKYTLRPHWDGCGDVPEMNAVAAYLTHAANNLPALVEALEWANLQLNHDTDESGVCRKNCVSCKALRGEKFKKFLLSEKDPIEEVLKSAQQVEGV